MRDLLRVLFLAVASALGSCVEPLVLDPDIAGEIVALEVEGQTRVPTVNTAARTINIEVGEAIDLAAVKVTRVEYVQTASGDIAAGSVLDLRTPLKTIVTTLAPYEWMITAAKRPAGPNEQRTLPGGSFDEWSRSTLIDKPDPLGKVWNPWPEGGVLGDSRWWDTGNKGVALIAQSNSIATEPGEGCPENPQGRAARLESIWTGVKAAGGNIYFGKFGKFTGVDATVEMGHPWHTKPKALKGWYKYFPQPIDRTIADYIAIHPYGLSRDQWMGSMDSLHVSVALWASPDGADEPFVVNTRTSAYVDITRHSEGIIAWGSFASSAEKAEWEQFDVTLEYFTDEPLPDHTRLIVQATASKHCNYFIAGTSGGGADGTTGSLMYVDEFELVY